MYVYGEEEPCAYTCFIYPIEFMLKVQIGFLLGYSWKLGTLFICWILQMVT